MRLATGPYPIDGGKHVTISLPSATLLVRGVIIGNLTPAAVTVTIAGQTSHLLPASANLYILSSGAQGIVVTSLGTATQSGTITAEWLTPATVPPSGYPFGGAVTNLTLGPDASVKITGPVTLAAGSTVKLTGPITIASGSVDISGGQLTKNGISLQLTGTTLLPSDLGSGATGTVTITTTATRTSDLNATNLTVDAGATLHTGGYRVLVQGTATVTGTVANVGVAGFGQGTSNGLGAPSGTLLGGGNGGPTTTPRTGKNAPQTSNALAGGVGGASETGAVGGIPSSTVRAPASVGVAYLRAHVLGGGGGGGGATDMIGGGGGGGLWLAASVLAGSGTISVAGGAGAAGTVNGSGGGGGGAAVVACRTTSFTGTVTARGGTPGKNGHPGQAGVALLIVTT